MKKRNIKNKENSIEKFMLVKLRSTKKEIKQEVLIELE